MNVNKISFNSINRTNFCAKEEKQNPKKEFWAEMEKQGIKKPAPLTLAITEGIGWFGIGMLTDKVLGKCFKSFQTSRKTALITNAILGLCFGAYTYFSEKKLAKNKEV